MPVWITKVVTLLVTRGRAVPWVRALVAAKWLYEKSKDFRDNLTRSELEELGRLLRKSKGDPRRLTAKQKERVRALVLKGVRGRKRG